MRSQGQVRFIKISSRLQIFAAAATVLMLLVWLVTMAAMAISQYVAARDRMALLSREAQVATSESRVGLYRDSLKTVAGDLAKRQDALEKLAGAHFGELPDDQRAGETVSDSTSEAQQTIKKVSAVLPEAVGLAQIEARQLAFVERLTRLADRRAAATAQAIRDVGLNPEAMLQSLEDRSAQGGPLIAFTASGDSAIDPRFQRLGLSLARMTSLERGLAGVPRYLPASLDFMSSGFGYRADPFTGSGAFHSGLDFKGPYGAPIYAAANGVVSFAGIRAGYGHTIEIDHGNGLLTRYAHMSGYRAAVGQTVAPGEVIGLIGNSGRSTGPHLHFEVRINDQAVDPRPFLEARSHVLEKTGSAASASKVGQ